MKTFLMMLLALLTLSAEAQPWPGHPRDRRDYRDHRRDPYRPQRPRRPQVQPQPTFFGKIMATDFYQGQFVKIDSCRYYGRTGQAYALQLQAVNDDVDVAEFYVQYENGQIEQIYNLQTYLYDGQATFWADLSGYGRCIDNVRIVARDRDNSNININIGGRRGGGRITIGNDRPGFINIYGLVR